MIQMTRSLTRRTLTPTEDIVIQSYLAELIRERSHQLNCPDGIDAIKMLWGLAGNESDFGANAAPRHNDDYCAMKSGIYSRSIVGLTSLWGCWAHCGYGPCQIMFENTTGITPMVLNGDPSVALQETILYLNGHIFRRLGAKSFEEIAFAYHTGSLSSNGISDNPYVQAFMKNYLEPMA